MLSVIIMMLRDCACLLLFHYALMLAFRQVTSNNTNNVQNIFIANVCFP